MTDIRSQLVEKIQARLETIILANGYASDIGAKVFPWRRTAMDAHSVPGIIFRDEEAHLNNEENQDEVAIGMWEHRLKLTVEIYFKSATPASVARTALNDLITAIYANRGDRWDGLAAYTDLIGHGIDVAQESTVICGARALFLIIYQTPFGQL